RPRIVARTRVRRGTVRARVLHATLTVGVFHSALRAAVLHADLRAGVFHADLRAGRARAGDPARGLGDDLAVGHPQVRDVLRLDQPEPAGLGVQLGGRLRPRDLLLQLLLPPVQPVLLLLQVV